MPVLTSKALTDVAKERQRQIDIECWTAEHDNAHAPGELSMAAAVYATWFIPYGDVAKNVKDAAWPWDEAWFKPKNIRHDLVRAAALIIAEIERHDRRRT